MTIPVELTELLGPIFEGRFYATWAPPESLRPYGVYQRVSNPEDPPTLDNLRNISEHEYQITAWSATYDLSDTLAAEVAIALQGYKSPAIQLVSTQGREDVEDLETLLRGSLVRCLIYTTEV